MRASRSILSSLAFGVLLVAVLIGTGLPLKLTAQQPVSLPTAGYVMSGVMEQAWLQRHGLLTISPAVGEATPEAPGFTPQFWPASYNVTRSDEQEAETQVLTASAGGTEYTIITYMRWQGGPNGAWRTRYRKLNGVQTLADGEFATPGYTWAGDPSLDANLYGGGVSPGRIYNAAVLINNGTTAIGVWYSDDQGSIWTGPRIIATESTAYINVDFPTLVVSPHQGMPQDTTLGYVYVIYGRFLNPPLSPRTELYVAKSTNGGVTFGTPSLVTSGTHLGGMQVLVAQDTGRVRPLWLDYDSGEGRMCESGINGDINHWQSFETGFRATYNFLGGTFPYTLNGNGVNAGIRAYSLPRARLNRPLNRVCVVWHEAEQPGAPVPLTDSYYTCKTETGWIPKVRVNDVSTNDQFQPSLVCDSAGTAYVGFYDRREDSQNHYFKLYGARLNADGVPLRGNYAISTNPNAADFFYPLPGFIGDYAGSWWHNAGIAEWLTAYTGQEIIAPTFYGDVYLGFSYY